MAKKKKGVDSEKLSDAIVKGMQEKKAFDIVVMDLRKVKNAVADLFCDLFRRFRQAIGSY
jgi:ribosome-associated protein